MAFCLFWLRLARSCQMSPLAKTLNWKQKWVFHFTGLIFFLFIHLIINKVVKYKRYYVQIASDSGKINVFN